MRILQLATEFIPQRGGIETVSSLLAREFKRLGHQSVVLTRTRNAVSPLDGIEVFRYLSPLIVLRKVLRADAVILHGIPARLAWPLAFVRRRAFLIKHMWDNPSPSRLRAAIARRYPTLCVSNYMASRGPAVNDVIPNPYDATIFNDSVEVVRDKDLVFMGRITGDKGVFDFISMVARLADNHPTLSATIIGNGPEFEQAQTRVRELNLTNHVRFTGELAPGPAAGELRRHRVFVFPALWDEPFGIVTLEAIACGAAVVAYASGGIPEAVGPCGIVVPTGDLGRLADATSRLLTDETARTDLLSHRETHLQRHRADTVAQRYVDCIKRDSARPLS